jgi:hypothetical protein
MISRNAIKTLKMRFHRHDFAGGLSRSHFASIGALRCASRLTSRADRAPLRVAANLGR